MGYPRSQLSVLTLEISISKIKKQGVDYEKAIVHQRAENLKES